MTNRDTMLAVQDDLQHRLFAASFVYKGSM